jgi:alpha-ketoglutarate-dependent 2,4-dichlorophenoxyacetate dioxygenase
MNRAEGEALTEELLAWTTQDHFIDRHEWTKGDLLIWDNTGLCIVPIPTRSTAA